ncbi:MAG: hypothetical protein EPN33_05600 [Acidobacteria bacterium]|nr:MAG: hypothetical protein EPN33_05600 [Acidobacteriota bacterium]
MRLRLSMVTVAVVLLAAGVVFWRRPAPGPNPYVLQVPATYLSVGQQFQPRLVSLAADAGAATDSVTLTLWSSAGKRLATAQVALASAASVDADPMALPHTGSFLLRAQASHEAHAAVQTITLHAVPEAAVDLGGVLPVTALGLAPGVMNYLRQHGFVLTHADLSHPMPPASRLLLVGQPAGSHLAAQYGWLWQQVASGAKALLLQPPLPAAVPYWPLAPPLVAPSPGACGDDAFAPPLTNGLATGDGLRALLHPPLKFDFSHDTTIALYHWNGYQIIPRGRGYPSCHALVSYRLGDGWVSQSTLPLLQHFQDVRARIYLMNLIMASGHRKHAAPASPGLAWVMRQRMEKLAGTPPPAFDTIYYRAPPTAVESAPVLVPEVNDANPNSCSTAPAASRPGASYTLDLGGAPEAVHKLTIAARGLPAFRLEASADGRTWKPLAAPATATSVTVPLPSGRWRLFRLTTTAPSAPWKLCQFSAR